MDDQVTDHDRSIKPAPAQWQFGLGGLFGLITVLALSLAVVRSLYRPDNPLILFFSLTGLGAFLPAALPRRRATAEFTPSQGSNFLLTFFMIGPPFVILATLLGMWLARYCGGEFVGQEFVLAGGVGAGLGTFLLVWGLGIRYVKR